MRRESYGLNSEAVSALHEHGVRLLICLDCGSSNIVELDLACCSSARVEVEVYF